MSVSYKVIGRHIQEARKQAKLTQRAVAEKLNMSDTYYGKIERGECRVNLERLAQISVLLHTPLEDCCAIGDSTNDLSMLRCVGHPIAMGNAPEEVAAAAEYVTSPLREDGIYRAMAHLHLI